MKTNYVCFALAVLLLSVHVAAIGAGQGNAVTPSLFDASAQNDVKTLKSLIKEGADVNAKDGLKRSPLNVAAMHGNWEVAKLLIAGGADKNYFGQGDSSLLLKNIMPVFLDFIPEVEKAAQEAKTQAGPKKSLITLNGCDKVVFRGDSGEAKNHGDISFDCNEAKTDEKTKETVYQNCDRFVYNGCSANKGAVSTGIINLSACDRVISQNCNSINSAKEHYDKAVKLHASGSLNDALPEYIKSIMMNNLSAACHSDLGELYRVMGYKDDAVAELNRAIEIDPKSANAYTTLGVVYDSQGQAYKAIEMQEKALNYAPDNYIVYYNLGHVYEHIGTLSDRNDAVKYYLKSISLNKDFAPAYDNLGVLYISMKNSDRAVELLEQAVAVGAKSGEQQLANYYNDLGAAYTMKKDYEKALENFEKAIKLKPDSMDIQRNLENVKEFQSRSGNKK